MATLNFHRLIMETMKIGIYCYVIADILRNILQKGLLSGRLPNIYFLSKPLNLIGCHGNQNTIFVKNIQTPTAQKLYGG